MNSRLIVLAAILPIMLLGLAGCSASAPYIYVKREFDRERPDFGEELKDRKEVSICYSKRGTTPETVRQMAETECEKFGRVAVFKEQEILACPVATPIKATYLCNKPRPAADNRALR